MSTYQPIKAAGPQLQAILVAAVVAVSGISFYTNAARAGVVQVNSVGPDFNPQNEAPTTDNPEFFSLCRASARSLLNSFGARPGSEILTHSKQWGFVYRSKVVFPKSMTGPSEQRIICWRNANDPHIRVELKWDPVLQSKRGG